MRYSTLVPPTFIRNGVYSVTEKCLFIILGTYAGESNCCEVGQGRLSEELKVTRKTINTNLQRLQEKGGLLILSRKSVNNKKMRNVYILADIDEETGLFCPESLEEHKHLKDQEILVEKEEPPKALTIEDLLRPMTKGGRS